MNDILVQTVEAGKYFSQPVYLDEKFILLSPETPFSERLKDRLQRWSYDYVKTHGEQSDTPGTEVQATSSAEASAPGNLERSIEEDEKMQEAGESYASLVNFAERIFAGFVAKGELPIRPVSEQVRDSLEMIKSHRDYILRFNHLVVNEKNYIVNHSVRTMILSLAVGMTMKMPAHKLIELGMAALLHEIGMVRLPPQLYMSERELEPKEKKAITAHTLLGFKILKQFSFPLNVCLAVLECRERIDGSGYPRALTCEKISTYAKVIMVCGAYAAMIAERPYRPPMDGHTAMMNILNQRNKQFDETVLKALVYNLSIYPTGTYVQVANGARGYVVEVDPQNPRAPLARLVLAPTGEAYAEMPVVKTTGGDYQIIRPLVQDEIKSLKSTANIG